MWAGLQSFVSSPRFLPGQQPHDDHAGSDKNAKLAVLFEEWSGAREDWDKSEMITQMRSKDKHRVKGCRKWLTMGEITAKYNSASIAWEICKLKLESETLSKSQVRYHPDLPGRDDMRQYLVYDYAEEVDQHDSVLESLFRCEDGDSRTDQKRRRRGRSPEKRKKQKKNKKVSSSSSTASSASRSSSQSSSQQSNQTRRTNKTTKGKKNKKDKKVRKDKEKEMTDADRKRAEKERAKEDEKEKKKLEKEEAKRQKEEEKQQEKARKKMITEQKREVQKMKEKKRSAAKKV